MKCIKIKSNGERCDHIVEKASKYCWFHNPDKVAIFFTQDFEKYFQRQIDVFSEEEAKKYINKEVAVIANDKLYEYSMKFLTESLQKMSDAFISMHKEKIRNNDTDWLKEEFKKARKENILKLIKRKEFTKKEKQYLSKIFYEIS